jgi:hypothetical protein
MKAPSEKAILAGVALLAVFLALIVLARVLGWV